MQVGPSCYQLAPSRSISVTGPLFPWQNEFQVAMQEQVNSPAISQVVRSGPEVGERLFTMAPLSETSWIELDIRPRGTRFFAADGESTVDEIASVDPIRNIWTPVKARATYQALGGEMRQFDFDVGVGVTIQVPPTNKVDVDLLVPKEEGIDELINTGAAPAVQAAALRLLRFATTVSCKATCVQYGNPVARPRYTQLYYLDGSVSAGSTGAQAKLQHDTGAVQILASPFAGGPVLALGDIVARFKLEIVTLPQGTAIDPFSSLFPFFDIPFVPASTISVSENVPVPRSHSNAVRVRTPIPAVRANVLVVQELFT